MRNAADVLRMARVHVPDLGSTESYLSSGCVPTFVWLWNPALGPLWSVVAQKVSGGSLAEGSEVELEVAELRWRDVHVSGSLLVRKLSPSYLTLLRHTLYALDFPSSSSAAHPSGCVHLCVFHPWKLMDKSKAQSFTSWFVSATDVTHTLHTQTYWFEQWCGAQVHADNIVGAPDSSGTIRFSHTHAARVRLEDCTITNQGATCYGSSRVQHSSAGSSSGGPASVGTVESAPDEPCFWKRKVPRSQSCRIVLRGRSEFEARGVEISGDAVFEVPDGQRMEVRLCVLLCGFKSPSRLGESKRSSSLAFPCPGTDAVFYTFQGCCYLLV